MRNGLVYALHKTGVYRLLDECRDFAERIQSSRQQSFSQFGEDQFLLERFKDRKGFYIDIGGNHPIRGSNTYALYRNGWEGLVVEPIERFYDKQRRRRPRDIQVNAAVGSSSGDMTFYEMIPSVLSTCEFDVAKEVLSAGRGRLLNEYSVRLATVADLYRMQMSPRPVSLLCVDTEGHDLAVLQGVDWAVLHPEIVMCEANELHQELEIRRFLAPFGYSCLKSLGGSLIFGLPPQA